MPKALVPIAAATTHLPYWLAGSISPKQPLNAESPDSVAGQIGTSVTQEAHVPPETLDRAVIIQSPARPKARRILYGRIAGPNFMKSDLPSIFLRPGLLPDIAFVVAP